MNRLSNWGKNSKEREGKGKGKGLAGNLHTKPDEKRACLRFCSSFLWAKLVKSWLVVDDKRELT